MLTHTRQLLHFEFPDAGGGAAPAPAGDAPAAEPFVVSEHEWRQAQQELAATRGVLDRFAASEQQAADRAHQERLEELAFEDPELYARVIAQREFDAQLAPIAEWMAQQQEAELHDQALDIRDDILTELGIPEEHIDTVHGQAVQLFPAVAQEFGEQYGQEWQEVQQHGPEAVEQWLSWLHGQVSVAALRRAAENFNRPQHEQAVESFYRAGGTVSDRMFSTGPMTSPPSGHDYRDGGSVSDLIFRS